MKLSVKNYVLPDTISKKQQLQPDNAMAMLELAHKMAAATAHTFTYGVAYQVNEYTADGTVFDFMAGVRQVMSCSWVQSHIAVNICSGSWCPLHVITDVKWHLKWITMIHF